MFERGPVCFGGWRSGLILLAAALAAAGLAGCGEKKAAPPAPPVVQVVNVLQQDVPVHEEYVGTTDGLVNAKVRAQVEGYLIRQNYHEGSFVKKGQVLFEIDPRPFQAALEQAKGQLAQNRGNYYTAKTTLEKALPLAKLNAVSKQDRDNAIGQERAARAAVEASQAAVRRAEINLSFTKITAPIDGIAGMATAQIGDLVGTSTSPELTAVSTVDPIKVYVPLSEQVYLEQSRAETDGKLGGRETSEFTMTLADGRVYPHPGRFYYLDRSVDVRTGTIRVAVLFPNPGNVLRPGQFARVRVLVHILKGALLVPQNAVSELQGAFEVAVVSPDGVVHLQPVTMGPRYGTWWVVSQGLQPGQRVVAAGVQKVREGQKVTPDALAVKPPAEPGTPAGAKSLQPTTAKTR
jgi:membrane fusion protein (multidrug efflux system)